MDELLKYAQYYKSLGYSVIAVGGNKESVHSWKKYQDRIIDDYVGFPKLRPQELELPIA